VGFVGATHHGQLNPDMKPLVGLIGGIGSGKSVVAGFLAELGAKVIEADKLGHDALRQPDIKEQVVERWGEDILNARGEVDRKKVGAIVFGDASEREALERIVHPLIERRIREEIDKGRQDENVNLVVLDAAILLEAGWGQNCDMVVFVDAPREERLKRLAQQRGWSTEEVEAREKAQLSLETKKARADLILDNSGTPAQTRERVEQLFNRLRQAKAI
jgi:dephospho-CoA kinase